MSNILWNIGVIHRCGNAYRASKLPDETLPVFHHHFLVAICDRPGSSQDQLARLLCMNKSTVTRRLSYLEENGYVIRRPSESDKRVMLVYPTDRALDLLPKIKRLTLEWSNSVTEALAPEELAELEAVLSRLAARAKALTGMDTGGAE
ncbi:MAG: MarR family transcriptional regulator [Clostridia bacterium]|nr:MarR family transcriptional regulator [Clostridia bacterium]